MTDFFLSNTFITKKDIKSQYKFIWATKNVLKEELLIDNHEYIYGKMIVAMNTSQNQ